MNLDQIQLTDEQLKNRKLFKKSLRRLKRVKELIINDKCRQMIKNKPLTTIIDIEFKY